MKLVIVPDTNIFMGRLDIISTFLNDNHPFNTQIFVLRVVLDELDKIKQYNKDAQTANVFLDTHKHFEMLKIEGEIDINGMEILLTYPDLSKLKNNDDKIVRIASSINNSVIITSDINMSLKCRSENVKCVLVNDKLYTDIKLEIMMAQTCAEPMEVSNDYQPVSFVNEATDVLKEVTKILLQDAYGAGYSIIYSEKIENASLEQIVDLYIKEFSVFSEYLHRACKPLLINIKDTLAKKNDEETKKRAIKNLYTLFRINKSIN